MKTKSIRQTTTFKASPHKVYEALMDAKLHARFTGGKATISRKVGGKFSVFDGYAEGINLELIPDVKIVQSWRAGDWPEGVYSKATFSFRAHEGNTRLTFTQTGVPENQYEDISQGWRDYYWAPMKEMLEK